MNQRPSALAILLVVGSAAGASSPRSAEAVQVDPSLRPYQTTSGVSGNLDSIGSDTLNNLMTLWAEGFRKTYPNVRIQVEGKGSSTAPPALIKGTAQIGPMSRAMKATEIDEFERAFGYEPTQIRVAIDALAVYVNKDNPLDKLTLEQVDAVFSSTLKCGHGGSIDRWDQLGLSGSWSGKPISLYGRNSASGTYGYFKTEALCKGDFRDIVKEQPGSASVVQGITEDLYGIGYSGIGYKTSGVRTLDLAKGAGEPYFSTDPETVLAGDYPLSRFLYLYVNKAPNRALDPLAREFLKFVLSRDGQETVVKDGYLPISTTIAERELAKLD
ncbi:MAG TPA: PstS family phosphate ABC transporter substrate-binding protein [Candidatus Polarisedimenticolaceae bacterium]|nr:PstS family phosphate ABC transporter substrate-binding protein [Candidatus Polarisedimenticolaceae bacterium]